MQLSGTPSFFYLFSQSCVCSSSVVKGQHEPLDVESLKREQLDTYKCYLLDCGSEIFVWMGRNTSLDERKSASGAAEVLPYFACAP